MVYFLDQGNGVFSLQHYWIWAACKACPRPKGICIQIHINRKSKCQFKEGSHVIQKHVHLHIFASGQIFPGPHKLIHQTLSCPHSFVKDLRNTIVTKSHYPVQGFQAKMDLNVAVFRKFHALMLGTGQTNWDIILDIDQSQYGKQPCMCCHGQ